MIQTGKLLQQRYRIEKQIGQGGMGAVYVATDERFGSVVAIKETLFMDDNYRKAIEREARLLNSLKHVALPRVTDHFIEENEQFLVMEYISGEDLSHTLEETGRPFPVDQVMKWADQLLDALDFLHNQVNPVIHRDIKPQNLKVTQSGQIILLDFGLAKGNPTDAGHQTAAKSIFGYSRNYASLEQIQGTGTDPRSDLYSLAATLYHLLTGRPPEDALTRAMAVLGHHPDPLVPANRLVPEIPAGVAGVLQKALSLNAAQRPATADEMRTMLRENEKYAELASSDFADAGPPPEIFSQATKILPGSTVQHNDRQTDIKTEVLPREMSQVTSVKSLSADGDPKRGRRFGLAAAVAAVLLTGTVLGGAYLYDPTLFTREETRNPEAVVDAPAAAANSIAFYPLANANVNANSVPEANTAMAAAERPADRNTTTAKTSEPAKSTRTQSAAGATRQIQAGDDDEVMVDGETVYIGNMKVGPDGQIETTNRVRTTPRSPNVPGVDPVIPPINMRHMTPRQRQRLLETLRKHRVTIAPSPTPPQN